MFPDVAIVKQFLGKCFAYAACDSYYRPKECVAKGFCTVPQCLAYIVYSDKRSVRVCGMVCYAFFN